MSVIISKALATRHRQGAIVSGMMVTIVSALRRTYTHKRNFSAFFEERLVGAAIRQNDEAGGEPLTITGIAKMLSLPRSNIKRATDALTGEGMVRKEGAGFVGDLAYLQGRADADYFKVIMAAILQAADDLRGMD